MRILVLGYIIRGPIGGMTWHHLQYLLGLKKSGHDVYFLEDSGDSIYSCYDPQRNVMDEDCTYGIKYATELFRKTGMENRWAYFNSFKNKWEGPTGNKILKVIANADAFINVSGVNTIRSWLADIPVRILIDTDPAFTQIKNLTDPTHREQSSAHNYFFTFGENFGKNFCSIPDDGFKWKPTRQPVFLNAWKVTRPFPASKWTTVMQWDSYPPANYKRKIFGMKSMSFDDYLKIPAQVKSEKFEIAMGSATAPVDKLRMNGWGIINSLIPTKNPWTYQKYISASKGEWTVAKHGYVATNSGWFSERSLCYMASGKPVLTQETGFSKVFPSGMGLLPFSSPEELKEGLKKINLDYNLHCRQSRKIVEEYFDSDIVLKKLLMNI